MSGAADLAILFNERALQDAFNFFDRDGNKWISKEELRSAMTWGWLSEKQLSQVFTEADTNKDDKARIV